MSVPRPIEHLVFPSFLQNHSLVRPGLDLSDPLLLERFLRFNALFTRGLVIADSDLNNNAVFHNAAQRDDGLFWSAVRSGFIRRAARADAAGNVLTQGEVADGLKRSSRWRYDLIPDRYPADLDAAMARAEAKLPPLTWTLSDVNRKFGTKLLALLASAAGDPSRDSAQSRTIEAIRVWVSEKLSASAPFGAADIESRLRPRQGGSDIAAWEAVWPLVLDAHTGNIPLVFGGRLEVASVPEASDRMLPGGPESGPEESAVQAQIYAGDYAARGIELEVRRRPSTLPPFDVSQDRLSELSLEQVEELREAAEPEEFLATCFHADGSGTAMAATADALRDATASFIERLARAGNVLTTDAQRRTLRAELIGGPGDQATETQVVATVNSREGLVQYAMLYSEPRSFRGQKVLGCDFTSLIDAIGQEQARELFGGDVAFHWFYKRPDYRVIELAGAAASAD
jgi:hypothetical protein